MIFVVEPYRFVFTVADVLSEVEGFNIQYPELPADMEEPVSSGAPVTGSDESRFAFVFATCTFCYFISA